jgi:phage-related baseplate assembly protein
MSGMLIPGQNQLAEPEIVHVENFEDLLAEFKAFVVEYVATKSPADADKLEASLENKSALLTLALEAFTVRLQTQERKYNARIKQMLAWWATGSNLDARLADMGLERQLLDAGDPDAYPPIPPTYESEEAARLRYYLAPHAPAAGSRMQYRREVLTLGDRPVVTVGAPSAGVVTVTYKFDPGSYAAQVKDGNGRRTGPGEVMVTVLARAGDGTPSAELLAAVRGHFARDDVRPETDSVTVQAAQIVPYKIRAVAYINPGPDAGLTKASAQASLQAYGLSCHRLQGRVDPSWIDYTLHNAGAVQLKILEPLAPIVTTAYQAPYCTAVDIEVVTL